MEYRFSRASRIGAIEISEIVRLTEQAATLVAQGKDVVALTTGEPDFPTPAHVIEAANAAATRGETRYPPTLGTAGLRDEIARRNNVERKNVIVSTGAKQVLANAMLASLNDGDDVVIPAPYWTSYSDIVTLAGGRPVVLPCSAETGFKLGPETLARALTPACRWLMLNAPSNPTGATYSRDELGALANVIRAHPNLMILVDEIYDELAYAPFVSFRAAAPDLVNRTLLVNGVSKAWAMTGWRIGWGVGPDEMIAAMGAVQGQVTSGASSISQAAALAALTGDQSILTDRRAEMLARRDRVVAALNALPGISCARPNGAFYVFPDIRDAIAAKGLGSDAEFCAALLDEQGLAIVPGRAFGLPGHARLSFAYANDQLDAGLERLGRFLAA
jgi:aspartate aminotransferase